MFWSAREARNLFFAFYVKIIEKDVNWVRTAVKNILFWFLKTGVNFLLFEQIMQFHLLFVEIFEARKHFFFLHFMVKLR